MAGPVIKKYIIYHIPGVKVGCTVNFEARKIQYDEGTVFEVLEELDESVGDKLAGDREWYWADHFGYHRGRHYSEYNWNVNIPPEDREGFASLGGSSPISGYKSGAAGRVGGRRQAELGMTPFQNFTREQQSEYGKLGGVAGGRRTAELGTTAFHTGAAGRASARSSLSVNNRIQACPHCNREIRGPGIANHIKFCKWGKMTNEWYNVFSIVTPDNPNLYYVD
jgi:hypothetical protein